MYSECSNCGAAVPVSAKVSPCKCTNGELATLRERVEELESDNTKLIINACNERSALEDVARLRGLLGECLMWLDDDIDAAGTRARRVREEVEK